MKTLNLIACVLWGVLSLMALIIAFKTGDFIVGILFLVFGSLCRVAYIDYKEPNRI